MTDKHFGPQYEQQEFQCPHCGVYAHQQWWQMDLGMGASKHTIKRAYCARCRGYTLWNDGQLIYPAGLIGPIPSDDMSDAVRDVYEEARAVAAASPRAAAALLRVCVEMVVNELVPGDAKLFDKIGVLVQRRLDPTTQKMLDSVRWYGNDGGAHPGEIDLKEQPEVVSKLMFCVNRIVVQMVTWPREADELYNSVPENKRKGIEDRDRKAREAS